MATQKPLIVVSGSLSQLPSGDVATVGRGILPPNRLVPIVGNDSSAASLTALRAYFMYMGQTAVDMTIGQMRFTVTTAGSGGQTAEAALYSSAAAPSGAAQDLTRIGAGTGTVDSLTTNGAKTATLNQAVSAGTHLWAAFRCNMVSVIPATYRTIQDMGILGLHTYAAPGALTSASSVTAASQTLPSFSIQGMALVLTIS